MNNVLIIQNTYYHFETAVSLYYSLEKIGFSPKIIQLSSEEDIYNQIKFINQYNMNLHCGDFRNYLCGFVVSAYPDPTCKDSLPNLPSELLSFFENRLIYISHRFKNESDYAGVINKNNALCLSPISERLGIDFYFQFENPTPIRHKMLENNCELVIQGHFELKSRTEHHIQRLLDFKKINLFILGHSVQSILENEKIENLERLSLNEDLSELDFYDFINSKHFISASISPNSRKKTYSTERFSSNFSLSIGLEKPLFCHDFFENIYNIPGIYYNRSNLNKKIQYLINLSNEEYLDMCNSFAILKLNLSNHNKEILLNKIKNNS